MKKKKDITSPCISVCTMEEDIGFCRGCFRSLDEISRWKTLSEDERSMVMSELDKRKILYKDTLKHPYSN